jgi:hypothetical protein
MSEFSKSYNIAENEESIVKYWNDNKIFEKSISQNKMNKQFIFMDGPPFSSGSPHYGHILVGTVKDTIGRWKTINNYCVERNAGWDTHGLPIEYEIEKKLGIKTKQQVLEYGIGNYNEACRDIVMRCAGEWKSTNNRLGRWVDFDNDYKTMDLEFMSKVWNVFSKIYEKGLIYEGVKIMPYSVACTTPLSNFEATSNYQNVSDRTVIVKFKLRNTNTNTNTFILSWTTTPWTLPSHYALCINKNITYVLIEHLIEHHSEKYYVAKTRLEFLCEKLKIDIKTITIISEVTGDKLVNLEYEPLYNFHNQKTYTIIEDDYVTDDSGTGVVHIAPAFGEDDYRVSLKYNLITKSGSSISSFPIIILDIPDYNGPILIPDCPTYVPICAIERKCETCHFCNRISLPLLLCKANTVHSMQGVTIGSNKFMNYMSLHYNGKKDEKLWANIGYVAFSRAQELNNLSIVNRLSITDFMSIGKSPTSIKINNIVNDIELNSLTNRTNLLNIGIGTISNFLNLIEFLINYFRTSISSNANLNLARQTFIDDLESQMNEYNINNNNNNNPNT